MRGTIRSTAPRTDGSFETIVVDAGAGTGQMAALANGPAPGDWFTARSWERTGWMVGTGTGNVYNNSVKNFDLIYGYAIGGGTNASASLADSNGNDLFVCKTEGANAYNIMQRVSGGSGPAAYLYAGAGFVNVYGYSVGRRHRRGGPERLLRQRHGRFPAAKPARVHRSRPAAACSASPWTSRK